MLRPDKITIAAIGRAGMKMISAPGQSGFDADGRLIPLPVGEGTNLKGILPSTE
jgi:hypothetical protein